MNNTQKIAGFIGGVGILAFCAIIAKCMGPGEYHPVQVRYEDGQMPVDKVYTYTDATYTVIEVSCPNGVVTVTAVTYEGQEVSDVMKDEIQEAACGRVEKN